MPRPSRNGWRLCCILSSAVLSSSLTAAASLRATNAHAVPLWDACRVYSTERLRADEKVVYFVRHAQGFHNVDPVVADTQRDPELTPYGIAQAQNLSRNPALAGAFPPDTATSPPTLVVVSPLRRTMHTAVLAFRNHTAPGTTWLLDPDVQELADQHICNLAEPDLGAAMLQDLGVPELRQQYLDLPAGWVRQLFQDLAPGAAEKYPRRLTELLQSRPEGRVVVVTHGGFMYDWYNTYRASKCVPSATCIFANAEVRAFALAPASGYSEKSSFPWRELPATEIDC